MQQKIYTLNCHGGAEVNRSLCMLSLLNRQSQFHRQTLGKRFKCDGFSGMIFIKGVPVSLEVWHVEDPLLLNDHEDRVKVNIYSQMSGKFEPSRTRKPKYIQNISCLRIFTMPCHFIPLNMRYHVILYRPYGIMPYHHS